MHRLQIPSLVIMSGRKILITGGLGYLGLWLTSACLQADYAVTIISRKSRNYPIEQQIELIECDLTNQVDCQRVLAGCQFDAVLHLASLNEGSNEHYAYEALLTNAWSTRNLLEYLPLTTHFIYFSTFHVYGRLQGIIDENTSPAPRSDYALTHYFAEQYIHKYQVIKGLQYSILRLSNIYGSPYYPDSSKWHLILNDLARSVYSSQEIKLQSNGLAQRDFLWKDDLSRIVLGLLQLPQATNMTLNISRERTWSMLDIAHEVQAAYTMFAGLHVPIHVNQDDTTPPPEPLSIKSEHVRSFLSYDLSDQFSTEAFNIFRLLAGN